MNSGIYKLLLVCHLMAAIVGFGSVVRFVAFGTGNWPARVPTAHSTDLTTWQEGPDALPQLPDWADPDPNHSLSWAPAALETSHGYILYVSLPDSRSGQHCIGAATSSVADGPYVGVGDGPLLCQHDLGGSIDPSVTRDRAGQLHMLWKDEGNTLGRPSSLWERRLTADVDPGNPASWYAKKRTTLGAAVAFTSLTRWTFAGSFAGAASTSNSVRAPVPLIDRPGPPRAPPGRLAHGGPAQGRHPRGARHRGSGRAPGRGDGL